MNSRTEAHLQQIAWYLGVPVSDFFGVNSDPLWAPTMDQSVREMLDPDPRPAGSTALP